jgi:hypothetical protein
MRYFDRSTKVGKEGEWSNWDENWDTVMLDGVLAQ